MDNFSELLKKRRSTRKFTDQKLSDEQVAELMRAVLMSPSSKRSNPWQFILVDDPEKIQQLSTCKENGSQLLAGAPLAVVVVADPLISDVWVEDASIATLILQLQAEDLGLGSCWIQVRNRFNDKEVPSDEVVREILNIPLQMQVESIVALGYKAAERRPFDEEKLQWEKLHINEFGKF